MRQDVAKSAGTGNIGNRLEEAKLFFSANSANTHHAAALPNTTPAVDVNQLIQEMTVMLNRLRLLEEAKLASTPELPIWVAAMRAGCKPTNDGGALSRFLKRSPEQKAKLEIVHDMMFARGLLIASRDPKMQVLMRDLLTNSLWVLDCQTLLTISDRAVGFSQLSNSEVAHLPDGNLDKWSDIMEARCRQYDEYLQAMAYRERIPFEVLNSLQVEQQVRGEHYLYKYAVLNNATDDVRRAVSNLAKHSSSVSKLAPDVWKAYRAEYDLQRSHYPYHLLMPY